MFTTFNMSCTVATPSVHHLVDLTVQMLVDLSVPPGKILQNLIRKQVQKFLL